jgi:hypothetical protein
MFGKTLNLTIFNTPKFLNSKFSFRITNFKSTLNPDYFYLLYTINLIIYYQDYNNNWTKLHKIKFSHKKQGLLNNIPIIINDDWIKIPLFDKIDLNYIYEHLKLLNVFKIDMKIKFNSFKNLTINYNPKDKPNLEFSFSL